MKKTLFLSSTILFSLLVTFNSCKKKQEVDNETQTVVDNALCEQQFMSVAPTVNERGTGSPKGQGFKIAICGDWITPTNTVAAVNGQGNYIDGAYTNGPATFTIDYTSGGCTDAKDGVKKDGKIYIKSSHMWSIVDSLAKLSTPINVQPTLTIIYDGYKADGVSYTGTVTITKPSLNTIRTQVSNGHCQSGSWNIEYNCDKYLTITTSGSTTEASIYGTSNGVNREGRSFSTSISSSSPIVKKSTCKWVTSGVIDVTPDGLKTRTVDFGNGDCDNKAKFTISGQTVEFNMQ